MPTLSRTQGRLPVPVLAAVAFLEPMPYRSQRSAILGKRVAKHGQAAGRGLTRHFVLDDVPVLFEQPVFHSYGVHHDPWGGQAVSGEPTAEEDHVAVGHDQLRLIGELGWQRLDEPEQAIAPRRDVCTVLDVLLSPESLGCGVVPLVEQGVERLAHDGLVPLICAVSHRTLLPSCTDLVDWRVARLVPTAELGLPLTESFGYYISGRSHRKESSGWQSEAGH